MARKITRDPNALTIADVPMLVREYRKAEAYATHAAKQAAKHKEELRKLVETEGYLDDKGNQWIDVDGVEGVKQGVKHEKRTRRAINAERLEKELKRRKLYSQATRTEVMLDEDKVWQLVWDEKLPQSVIDECTEESVTWAFKVV